MGVVAKFFIQQESVQPSVDSLSIFSLGVVCRGELNKDWAAATPSGNAKLSDPVLSGVWAEKRAGMRPSAEVEITLRPDDKGEWEMESCAFSYGGCVVKFRQKVTPWGDLQMTVNASAATATLRKVFAEALVAGVAPRFSVEVQDSPEE